MEMDFSFFMYINGEKHICIVLDLKQQGDMSELQIYKSIYAEENNKTEARLVFTYLQPHHK